jgi:predicted ATPase/DNA-binding SARP family transcriptional activator
MRYQLLGPLEVVGDDGGTVALAGGRERVLVATLVLGANQVVSTDRLVDALWGDDPPATADNALQVHVSKLRKKLSRAGARESLSSAPKGYVLSTAPGDVDLEEFEQLVSAATGEPAEISARLREALALWRGPALADVSSDLLRGVKTRLEELRLLTVERCIEAELAIGRHADLVGEIEALVQADPLREGPRRQLMLALYRSGRQADALATYREAREVLAEELGINPGSGLQALELAILNQDPELEAPLVTTGRTRTAGPPTGTVTQLMSDVEGSTRLWEENPEEMAVALSRHDELLRRAIEENGGYVVKTMGDAFHAAFPTAKDAMRAAETAQRTLSAEPWPEGATLRVRMALHTGECEERDGDYFGPAVNRTARLVATAHGGQVVVSRGTADLVGERLPPGIGLRDLGTHHLKDLGRPEDVFQLDVEGLDTAFPPLRSLDNPQLLHNLPELVSSFVGRETEVIEVQKLMESSRLVTLTGAGGSGKTRLALQVAAETLDDFAEGVWLVELASLAAPALVTSAVASALGVRDEPGRPLLETLVNALSDRYLLVLLDNCEHLLNATATLADTLVRSCPRLCVLATSREPLAIDGERAYRVPSLSLPGPDQVLTPDEARSFDAVRLFADRAVGHRPAFVLDDTNAAIVASLCRKLDGMPLAIELATARLGSLSVANIEQRLDDRFGLLTRGARTAHPRQQTLHALVDWSYDLLDESEQTIFRRLSVFGGGWTLNSAETVCSGNDLQAREVADILGSLVDKSLVQADPVGNDLRYKLLETIRQYAAKKLSQRGDIEVAAALDRHAHFFLNLAEVAASHLRGADQALWFARLDAEHDNFRSALSHFMSHPALSNEALRMAVNLLDFWLYCGHFREGIDVLEEALDRLAAETSAQLEAAGLLAAARLHFLDGDLDACRGRSFAGLSIAREIDDRLLVADALEQLASVEHLQTTDLTNALAMVEEAVEMVAGSTDPIAIAEALEHRGMIRVAMRLSGAQADYEIALERYQNVGNRLGAAQVLNFLAILELKKGKNDASRSNIRQALANVEALHLEGMAMPPDPFIDLLTVLGLVELLDNKPSAARQAFIRMVAEAEHFGIRTMVSYGLIGLAFCAHANGDFKKSAMLHGAGDRVREELELLIVDADLHGLQDLEISALRKSMGPAFELAYESGHCLALSDAVALALADGTAR